MLLGIYALDSLLAVRLVLNRVAPSLASTVVIEDRRRVSIPTG